MSEGFPRNLSISEQTHVNVYGDGPEAREHDERQGVTIAGVEFNASLLKAIEADDSLLDELVECTDQTRAEEIKTVASEQLKKNS